MLVGSTVYLRIVKLIKRTSTVNNNVLCSWRLIQAVSSLVFCYEAISWKLLTPD